MASGTGIGEFFISLTVDAAQGALTVGDLVQSMGHLEVATLAEIGLLWEFGVQLARVTDAGIQASLGFAQFTMHTGLSAQELQKWQIIAQQSHAAAEDVTGSVENLTKHLANLAVGIPDAALGSLQQLGISAFASSGKLKSAFDILGEVRARLGVVTSDAGQQERILAGLGISPNLRETLLLSQTLFNQRAQTAHGMTPEQQKAFDETRQTFVEIGLRAKDIGLFIGAWISPEVTKWLKWVEGVFGTIKGGAKEFADSPIGGKLVEGGGQYMRAEKNALGDLLNVLAGRGFDSKDFWKSIKEMGGAQTSLFGSQLPFFMPDYLLRSLLVAAAPAAGATPTTITKQDTYHIHDAHNPDKIVDVMEKHWDNLLSRKTIDGFDRQTGNGGY